MAKSVATKLHERLLALGCNVDLPKRIWLGRAYDHSDLWRWEAPERVSGGASFVGCEHSMRECLALSDGRLKFYLDHSSGNGFFYPDYHSRRVAGERLKDQETTNAK